MHPLRPIKMEFTEICIQLAQDSLLMGILPRLEAKTHRTYNDIRYWPIFEQKYFQITGKGRTAICLELSLACLVHRDQTGSRSACRSFYSR
jgi:hypothetical protein